MFQIPESLNQSILIQGPHHTQTKSLDHDFGLSSERCTRGKYNYKFANYGPSSLVKSEFGPCWSEVVSHLMSLSFRAWLMMFHEYTLYSLRHPSETGILLLLDHAEQLQHMHGFKPHHGTIRFLGTNDHFKRLSQLLVMPWTHLFFMGLMQYLVDHEPLSSCCYVG